MAIPPTNPQHPLIESAVPARTARLSRILLITFLGSMGTAVVTNGIAFIADQGLGYSGTQNLILGLVIGATYIPAAFFSGPLLRKLVKNHPAITTRRVLLTIMVLLSIVAQGPLLADRFAPNLTEAALWLMGLVFMLATGIQWPIIEAYLSGGRRGKPLRSAIGKFNIVWSSAIVLVYWLMAPLLASNPFLIVSILGALHIVIATIIAKLPDEPAQHIDDPHDEHHEPHPLVYVPLLKVFRMMLISSYIILAVMGPLMPSIESRLGLAELWWTPIASTWLMVRVLFFILFERWHGWHGRWSTPWIGMIAMMLGFACAMIAPLVGTPNETGLNLVGVLVLIGGLSLAGIGIAATYYGALYYAMAVGNSDVDAGGKHEALIGVGYTVGPLCGLAGGYLNQQDTAAGWGVIGVTSAVVLTMVAFAARSALKSSTSRSRV